MDARVPSNASYAGIGNSSFARKRKRAVPVLVPLVDPRWGVTPPINQDARLGDMIDAEQAAGLCEALTGLDGSDVSRFMKRGR